jgi:hypothetical protein
MAACPITTDDQKAIAKGSMKSPGNEQLRRVERHSLWRLTSCVGLVVAKTWGYIRAGREVHARSELCALPHGAGFEEHQDSAEAGLQEQRQAA